MLLDSSTRPWRSPSPGCRRCASDLGDAAESAAASTASCARVCAGPTPSSRRTSRPCAVGSLYPLTSQIPLVGTGGKIQKGERKSRATEIRKGERKSRATEIRPGEHKSRATEIRPGERKSRATEFQPGHKLGGAKKGEHRSEDTEYKSKFASYAITRSLKPKRLAEAFEVAENEFDTITVSVRQRDPERADVCRNCRASSSRPSPASRLRTR